MINKTNLDILRTSYLSKEIKKLKRAPKSWETIALNVFSSVRTFSPYRIITFL
jgi:hypothetical protein